MSQVSGLLAHAEALIAEQRFPEAVASLSQGVRGQAAREDRLLLAHRLIRLLIQLGQHARARLVLAQVEQWAPTSPPAWLEDLAFKLGPSWGQPLQGPALRLRTLERKDARWLKDLFLDEAFAASVNRDYGERVKAMSLAAVADHLDAQSRQLPVEMGAHVLVIEQHVDGERLGLACLVAIDAPSRRAEFIMGLSQPESLPASRVAEITALMLDLAFQRLGLHRVTASVYSDNPRLPSLKRSLHAVGFEDEGVQRQHVRLPAGRHIDLHWLGALREEVLKRPLTRRLLKRYPGMLLETSPT